MGRRVGDGRRSDVRMPAQGTVLLRTERLGTFGLCPYSEIAFREWADGTWTLERCVTPTLGGESWGAA